MQAQKIPENYDEWLDVNAKLILKQQELVKLLTEKSQAFLQKPQIQQDPMSLQKGIVEYWAEAFRHPDKVMQSQAEYLKKYSDVAQNTLQHLNGGKAAPIIAADKNDRRFRDPRWTENPVFDYLRQTYLLTAQYWQDCIDKVAKIDPQNARKLRFAARQYIDAMSPSNFWMTNPEVLDETLKSKGQNLLKGMENLIHDLKSSDHFPKISMVKKGMFEVGKNLALTPGKVVFQNDILQVIQYEPSTKQVYKTPLVIISPWINKYYILDMQAENSFVKWCVDQGHTVFISSWANPTEKQRDKTWDDYAFDGLNAAIKAAQDATGEKQVNVIGYCIGGTLLASLLGYWAARGETSPVKSATYFTAMIDFEDSGELSLFTDEAQILQMEELMEEKGYLDAWHLHTTFNMLRANDLIWSFVVNNYLLGREPFPFDLLHWNSDSTGIPAKVHSFYLRQMYLLNHLSKPGKMSVKGTALDVRQIDTPSYFISTIDDHIAPWKTTYTGAQLLGGDITFTLAGSGHIAGIVNPPVKNKYGYWTNDKLANSADDWYAKAKQYPGSWWTHWNTWIKPYAGKKVAARIPGKGKLKVIEAAPGSYVKVKTL
jgi:polyhydroxyalkanoate synthase